MSDITDEAFIKLVKKSEAEASNHPQRYKLKLSLFAALGYFVIFFVLILLIGLTGGLIGLAFFSTGIFLLLVKKKLIFVILFAIWTLLKALWVRFPAPNGYKLKPKDAPKLFEEVSKLQKSLDSLTIHEVLITNELNAAIVQHPRLGILGWTKNTLILGNQLLLALSADEARAVIAHELGHLSGNHSKFSAWIYRVRISWQRVMSAFEQSESFGANLMRRFFDWYTPKFSAYSFALARENEYEADKISAELTSSEVAAKALVNIHALAPSIDKKYWEVYFKTADKHPEPLHAPYEGLANFLKNSDISRAELLQSLKQELEHETHYADTHPSLKDRVTALTSQPVLPERITQNAAETWLGDSYKPLLKHFDHIWLTDTQAAWTERYEYAQKCETLIEENKERTISEIDREKLWELAEAIYEFRNEKDALIYYKQCLAFDSKAYGAAFKVGKILCSSKDLNAISYLRNAFESRFLIEAAARLGFDLLTSVNRKDEAEDFWQEALERNKAHQAVYEELNSLGPKDTLETVNLEPALWDFYSKQLAAHKKVKKAWIAKKRLSLGTDESCYVICVDLGGLMLSYDALIEKIANSFESESTVFFVCTKNDTKKIAKKVKKLKQRLI